MGFLLKIILFGVAIYALWRTFARWKGLYDRFVGRTPEPPRRAPPPAQPPPAPGPAPEAQLGVRRVVVEDTVQCAGCGAYISSAADKCGQCGRPRGT
jgi:hypothetical protein